MDTIASCDCSDSVVLLREPFETLIEEKKSEETSDREEAEEEIAPEIGIQDRLVAGTPRVRSEVKVCPARWDIAADCLPILKRDCPRFICARLEIAGVLYLLESRLCGLARGNLGYAVLLCTRRLRCLYW